MVQSKLNKCKNVKKRFVCGLCIHTQDIMAGHVVQEASLTNTNAVS